MENKENEKEQKNNENKDKILWIILILGIILFFIILGVIVIMQGREIVDEAVMMKPIIYLYPEEETQVSVTLGNPEKITCSYPKYEGEWQVTAYPDGTLVDKKTDRTLYSLYWEGRGTTKYDKTKGFCIKGEDTASFLEEKLRELGLNDREAEEFIIYWLPKMEKNKYNYIRFASMEEINEYMPLEFSVKPDTVIRVFMQFKPLNKYMEVEEQTVETPERKGFIAVEWGGTELK